MTLDDIEERLTSTKSSERRFASKEIGKRKQTVLGENLFVAFKKEKSDSRTWETQVEMIIALGLIDFRAALQEIEPIVELNKSHDMITYAAAQTFVRLTRQSLKDAQPIIKLLKFGGLSLVDGALNPLAYDKMVPSEQEILELIELSWDLHKHHDRVGFEYGYTDPRYGLAAACAGWDKQLTTPFLNHCIATANNDTSLKKVAEKSLKGIISKLR